MITLTEQEVLFRRVCERFNCVTRWVSGYVHGIMDGGRKSGPDPHWKKDALAQDEYALGYLQGFVDEVGVDALCTKWAAAAGITTADVQWWKDADAATVEPV